MPPAPPRPDRHRGLPLTNATLPCPGRATMKILRSVAVAMLLTPLLVAAQGTVPVPENEMALVAARQGNLGLWREMLKLGASPHARDAGGSNALVMAVLSEREDMLREVLQQGVDVNAVGGGGMSALAVAVTRGHLELVQRLLRAGARPDVADAKGATPLAIAIRLRRTEIARLLLAAGADASRADELRTSPLHLAAESGNTELVTALLAADADPNVFDSERRSPVFLALFEQHEAAARTLLAHRRTDPRLVTQGYSPREWAERTGHPALAELIDGRLAGVAR